MCQYCKNGISFISTNMVKVAIDYTVGNEKNLRINCFNIQGEEIIISDKIKFCPMCGRKLWYVISLFKYIKNRKEGMVNG